MMPFSDVISNSEKSEGINPHTSYHRSLTYSIARSLSSRCPPFRTLSKTLFLSTMIVPLKRALLLHSPLHIAGISTRFVAQEKKNMKMLTKNSLETIFDISHSCYLQSEIILYFFSVPEGDDGVSETRFLPLPLCGSLPVQQPLFHRRGRLHQIRKALASTGISFSDEAIVAMIAEVDRRFDQFESSDNIYEDIHPAEVKSRPFFRAPQRGG